MKNKKGAMSIALVIFIVAVSILFFLSILSYIRSKNLVQDKLETPGLIDSLYINSNEYELALQNIFDNSVKDFTFEQGKQKFIENYLAELRKQKEKAEVHYLSLLNQVESQINEKNIELSEEKIALNLKINLWNVDDDGSFPKIRVEYSPLFRFEKDL